MNILEKVTNMYTWFNHIGLPQNPFDRDELEKYYAKDFVMIMNSSVVCSGHQGIYDHFEDFRKSGFVFQVQLPLHESIQSIDSKRCAVKYAIHKKNEMQQQIIDVIAIWEVDSEGKFIRMDEVVNIRPLENLQ